eukprot:2652614-Amphidinium_carterae.1
MRNFVIQSRIMFANTSIVILEPRCMECNASYTQVISHAASGTHVMRRASKMDSVLIGKQVDIVIAYVPLGVDGTVVSSFLFGVSVGYVAND